MRFIHFKETNLLQSRQLGLPALIVGMLVGLAMVNYGLVTPLPSPERWLIVVTGVLGVIYAVVFLFFFLPLGKKRPTIWWLTSFFHSLSILWLMHLEPANLPGISILTFATLLLVGAILMGRWPAYFFVFSILLLNHFLPTVFATTLIPLDNGLQASIAVISIVLVETIQLFQKIIQQQVRRLEIVNQMTRSLAYSIEMKQVIALMSGAIQSALNADTYFIGFLNGAAVDLELFYDDGEFFQGVSVPIQDTLVGKVVQKRDSILLTDTIVQVPQLGLPQKVVGKPQSSLSWMGTPLQMHHNLFGVAAVASYHKNAFNDADLELLENFAHQASIALDNAFHHAEVERKSTQDSLTQVSNHGNFLESLTAETQKAELYHYPLSLIMLDIDFFKRYNDNYGHIVGDQVLVRLTELVRRYVKSSDLVGRWGGEEFAIALPRTSGDQAAMVAERIRKALRKVEFLDRDGKKIPSPTISQGIAVFPSEAGQPDSLVDLADQRLYIAKKRGRDQIEPAAIPIKRSSDGETLTLT